MDDNAKSLTLRAPKAADAEDEKLVQACLNGDEKAWERLIDKYKRLIYSVPVKYGFAPEDAADLFQNVCVDLYTNLSKLRKVESLRSWLITVATLRMQCVVSVRRHAGPQRIDGARFRNASCRVVRYCPEPVFSR